MIADVRDERHDPHDPDLHRLRCPSCDVVEYRQSQPGKVRCEDCDRLMATTALTADVDMQVYVASGQTTIYHDHPDCFALQKADGNRQVKLSVIDSHYTPCSYCGATEQ